MQLRPFTQVERVACTESGNLRLPPTHIFTLPPPFTQVERMVCTEPAALRSLLLPLGLPALGGSIDPGMRRLSAATRRLLSSTTGRLLPSSSLSQREDLVASSRGSVEENSALGGEGSVSEEDLSGGEEEAASGLELKEFDRQLLARERKKGHRS